MPKPWLTLTVKLATRAGRVQEREEALMRERLVRRIAKDLTGRYLTWSLQAALQAARASRQPDKVQPAGYALYDFALYDFQKALVERWLAKRYPVGYFLASSMTWNALP